jgi:hypothetical protein
MTAGTWHCARGVDSLALLTFLVNTAIRLFGGTSHLGWNAPVLYLLSILGQIAAKQSKSRSGRSTYRYKLTSRKLVVPNDIEFGVMSQTPPAGR